MPDAKTAFGLVGEFPLQTQGAPSLLGKARRVRRQRVGVILTLIKGYVLHVSQTGI